MATPVQCIASWLLHLPLVRKLAHRLCGWFGVPPEDAEQLGFLGLMEAAQAVSPGLRLPILHVCHALDQTGMPPLRSSDAQC